MALRAAVAAVVVGCALGLPTLPLVWSPMPWTAVHQWSPLAANVTVLEHPDADTSNITARWRILHITDAHISLAEASDLHQSGTRRMHNAFRSVQDKYYERGPRRTSAETFKRLLNLVRESEADVVVLTGDIVNFPHNASVQFVLRALAAVGCGAGSHRVPALFTAGNHDWLVEGLGRSRAGQQTQFRQDVLKPLYCLTSSASRAFRRDGGDFSVLELAPHRKLPRRSSGGGSAVDSAAPGRRFGPAPGQGLLLLTLDNSRLEVSSAQAAFVWQELARGIPTILAVHVPFKLEGATPKNHKEVLCGDPRYGFQGDTSWHVERRERWPHGGAPASTLRFVEDLVQRFAAPRGPLLGILSGHEHLHRADALGRTWPVPPLRLTCKDNGTGQPKCEHSGSAHVPGQPLHEGLVQYVTPPAFEGGHRIVEVRDARPAA